MSKSKKSQKSHHNPGIPRKTIKDTSEKALQRAIWASKYSILGKDSKVQWIDFELPVNDSGKARDNCIDLLGIDDKGTYVICEVKYSGKGRGHGNPVYACDEVRRYNCQLETYGKLFKLHRNNDRAALFSLEDFLSSKHRLIIVGDRRYWGIWESSLSKSLPGEIEYYAINVSNDEFTKQRDRQGGGYYKPTMPANGITWNIIKP